MLFSPYLFAWSHYNPKYPINSVSTCIDHNIPSITLAFLVNNKYDEINDWIDEIRQFNNKINIRLSIGGANGWIKDQGQTCEEVFEKIKDLLHRSGIREIDLDIEGEVLKDDEKIEDLIKIVKLLLKEMELVISLTLPVEFNGGLNEFAINTICKFQKNGINIRYVNLMLMDFFTPFNGDWYIKHIEIIEYVYRNQLNCLGIDYNHMGICPMIGENDDHTKFTLNDWNHLLNFAISKNIGLITFWAINRDQKNKGNGLKFWKSSINTHSNCQDKDLLYTEMVSNKL